MNSVNDVFHRSRLFASTSTLLHALRARSLTTSMAAGDAAWALDCASSNLIPFQVLAVPGSVDHLQRHHAVHAEPLLCGTHGTQHSQKGAPSCTKFNPESPLAEQAMNLWNSSMAG